MNIHIGHSCVQQLNRTLSQFWKRLQMKKALSVAKAKSDEAGAAKIAPLVSRASERVRSAARS